MLLERNFKWRNYQRIFRVSEKYQVRSRFFILSELFFYYLFFITWGFIEIFMMNHASSLYRDNFAINMVLSRLTAPPMNPFAWTKSMSLMLETAINFSPSLIPLHYFLSPFLNSNEPSLADTACILHFLSLDGNITYKILPSHFYSSSSWTIAFCHGIYLSKTTTFPDGWTFFLILNASFTIEKVWIDPSKADLTSVYNSSSATFMALWNY